MFLHSILKAPPPNHPVCSLAVMAWPRRDGDPGGSVEGRGSRPGWPRALRAGRRRGEGLPKRIPAWPDEDGGGHGRVFCAAGARHARPVRLGDSGESDRPHAGSRGFWQSSFMRAGEDAFADESGRRLLSRSHASLPPASVLITQPRCHPRSRASRTTSKLRASVIGRD